jgi:hypothetical protein
MTNSEGHYITLSSESMPMLSASSFGFFFIVEIVTCSPLGTGRLESQPFKVSETFSTPGCFEVLFTYGMILVNSGRVQLQLADFCVDISEFFIIVMVMEEVCSDAPVLKLVGCFNHVEELWVWSSKDQVEPLGQGPCKGFI